MNTLVAVASRDDEQLPTAGPIVRPLGELQKLWDETQDAPRRALQVLDQLVAGCSYAECADALFISESTVRGHLERMKDSLGMTVAELKSLRVHDYSAHITNLQATVTLLRESLESVEDRIQTAELENKLLRDIIRDDDRQQRSTNL